MDKEKDKALKGKKDRPKKARRLHPLRYLREMWGEVKKLTWLHWKDLIKYTGTVIAFILLMSAVIFACDLLFGAGVKGLNSISGGTEATVAPIEIVDPTTVPTIDPAATPEASSAADPASTADAEATPAVSEEPEESAAPTAEPAE
jgi:preprotein translocase SecE subunit